MKRILLLCFVFVFVLGNLRSQSLTPTVIASAGDYLTNGTMSLSFTLGEVAVTTLQSTDLILTQGFQQPFELDVANAVESKPVNWSVKAYPNPVVDMLTLRFKMEKTDDYVLQLMDITGKKLVVKELENMASDETYQIDMSGYAPGIYLLNISSKDHKTNKIYKLRKK